MNNVRSIADYHSNRCLILTKRQLAEMSKDEILECTHSRDRLIAERAKKINNELHKDTIAYIDFVFEQVAIGRMYFKEDESELIQKGIII